MSSTVTNRPETKCAHAGCNCSVQPGQQYCSDACAKAPDQGLAATDCNCKHESCAVAA